MEETSAIEFDLGGVLAGTQRDIMEVSNVVRFAGELRVQLAEGFVPASNSVFTLMRFASATGAFDNAPTGSRINLGGSSVSCIVEYSSNVLQLSDFFNASPATNEIDVAWAIQYFGHSPLSEEEKYGDADQDGLNNFDEYLAGTNPRDATSVLKILAILNTEAGSRIRFQCVNQKLYSILFSRDLLSWTEVSAPVYTYPAPGTCEWFDNGSQSGGLQGRRFYRVLLK